MMELSATGRNLATIEEMAKEMSNSKDLTKQNTARLYKKMADEHKGDWLQSDIQNKLTALQIASKRGRVDWKDLEQVQQRTYDYLNACSLSETYPSVMGLAVYGYGVSRQALNQYLASHNNPTTDFIEKVKDIMADILTNASLYNNANAVQVIFQLKNHFNHTDTVQLQPVQPKEEDTVDIEEIMRRYGIIEEDLDDESKDL